MSVYGGLEVQSYYIIGDLATNLSSNSISEALDSVTENSVQDALDRLGSDRTVLVIAHRLGTIRNADNIIVLGDGVVAEQGTHDELMQIEGGKYAAMWNMQLHSARGIDKASTESLTALSS